VTIAQVVRLQAAEGKADELWPLLEAGRGFALTVDGCEGFEIYQGTETAESFVMIERWASVEQHQRHFETNVVGSGVLDRVSALLAAPLEFEYYDPR
jgi:quinol monooxygenase YgiN